MRPILSKDLSAQDFRKFYWLKMELQTFCRENGMSPSGSKVELSTRISTFLESGEIQKPLKAAASSLSKVKLEDLNLETIITQNHRCSQAVRNFFKSIIPNFHFSTYIQNYFKDNAGGTYRDVVNAWHEEEKRKKDPSYKTTISPQFEYNQFIRDFFSDPQNKEKGHRDAIAAWNTIKKLPGSNKYIPNS